MTKKIKTKTNLLLQKFVGCYFTLLLLPQSFEIYLSLLLHLTTATSVIRNLPQSAPSPAAASETSEIADLSEFFTPQNETSTGYLY